jgi:hypothetical protein
MSHITARDILAARRKNVWDTANKVLYDLCKRFPHHRARGEIIAKMLVIGRVYAASIERRRNAKHGGDDFYIEVVAPAMQRCPLDAWLKSISQGVVAGDPCTIVVHQRLMDRFQRITGLEKRSLASKYLHFHRPNHFFIYDSRSRNAVKKLTPRLNDIPDIKVSPSDKEYKDFVRRCTWLRDDIYTRHRTWLTPRELDNLLLRVE